MRPTNEWQGRLDFLAPDRIFHSSIRNAFGIFSAQKIAGFVRRNDIDIVHAHLARDYVPASLVCRMAKTPKFVLTRHVLFPMKPFHRLALRNLSKAIAVSAPVAVRLRSIFPSEKITVISNGIDARPLDDAKRRISRERFREFHGIPADSPLVVTVGELKPLKGQTDFVLAAGEVLKSAPDARFAVVGQDNTIGGSFRRELKRLIRVFGADERFLFLDWAESLEELFAASDLFVSPSHSESFGLAILEAMLNLTPIVATATEGATELLRDGESAALVPVGDPVAMASAAVELLNDAAKRSRFAEAARSTAAEQYSLKSMIDRTEELYEAIISG